MIASAVIAKPATNPRYDLLMSELMTFDSRSRRWSDCFSAISRMRLAPPGIISSYFLRRSGGGMGPEKLAVVATKPTACGGARFAGCDGATEIAPPLCLFRFLLRDRLDTRGTRVVCYFADRCLNVGTYRTPVGTGSVSIGSLFGGGSVVLLERAAEIQDSGAPFQEGWSGKQKCREIAHLRRCNHLCQQNIDQKDRTFKWRLDKFPFFLALHPSHSTHPISLFNYKLRKLH